MPVQRKFDVNPQKKEKVQDGEEWKHACLYKLYEAGKQCYQRVMPKNNQNANRVSDKS